MCNKLFCVNKAFQVVIFSFFSIFWYWIIYIAKFPSCGKTKIPRTFLQAWQRLFILENENGGKGSSVVAEDMQPELPLPLFMRKSSSSEQWVQIKNEKQIHYLAHYKNETCRVSWHDVNKTNVLWNTQTWSFFVKNDDSDIVCLSLQLKHWHNQR